METFTFKRRIRPVDGYTHCVHCKEVFSPANVFTELGAKETQISGMCEKCFDDLFDDEE